MKTLNEKLIPLLELLEILELANLSTFSTDPDHLCEKCSLHSKKAFKKSSFKESEGQSSFAAAAYLHEVCDHEPRHGRG